MQQFAGLVALAARHARDWLVQQHQLGLLHQQHPDFEPLFLPVRERPRQRVAPIFQADDFEHLVDSSRCSPDKRLPSCKTGVLKPIAASRFS